MAIAMKVFLRAETLAAALERVECASVIVCGSRAAMVARRLVREGKCALKVHEDDGRDPDGWELF